MPTALLSALAKTPPVSTVRRYAYLNTLISALSGRLLSSVQLQALVEQPTCHATALLHTAGLEPLPHEEIEHRSLEQRWVGALLQEGRQLARPLAKEGQEFVRYWLRRFEIANLKAAIRGKLAGHSSRVIRADLNDMGAMAAMPVETLLEAEDAFEMLRRLEGTPYGEIARHTRSIYEERRMQSPEERHQEWFFIEAVIDREYFAGLDKRLKVVCPADRHYLRPLVGAVIDQVNLVWLLRYRFAYRLAPPLTYFLLCPGGYHLRRHHLLNLVRGESLEEVLRQVPFPLQTVVASATSIPQVEMLLENYGAEMARILLKHTRFNLGRVLAYLFLREKNLSRLHGALKGRALGLAPALICEAIAIESKDIGETPL
jgi:V/A-type H+/Na+-transporting ATPase subunit C